MNWVQTNHQTSTQTHFTFQLSDGQQLIALADSRATTSMMPLREAERLRLNINTTNRSSLIGANNLPIRTMGSVSIPIKIKNEVRGIHAHISPNPNAPTILGLNFLHAFKLTISFDGDKTYLTDALQNYDFATECCLNTTPKQQAVSSNINFLVTEQIPEQHKFKGTTNPIIIPDDSDIQFDPLQFDQ